MNGNSRISGNNNNYYQADVAAHENYYNIYKITLSGKTVIGTLTLTGSANNCMPISLSGAYMGAVSSLNLHVFYSNLGDNNTWLGQSVIEPRSGYILSSDDIGRFTLGQFTCDSSETQNITGNSAESGLDNYYIEILGNYGRLRKNVRGVTLNMTTLSLTVGGSTGTLTPTVEPSDAFNKNVTWSSSNTGIATVSNGVVSAVGPGTAIVTVRTADSGHTATCAVTVTQPVSGVTLNKTSTTINVGGTETLSATVAPNNASDKTVNWSTSAPGVATVNNGVVTAVSAGKANITVTTADSNHTASCEVTVTVYFNIIDITVNDIEDGTPVITIPQGQETISQSGTGHSKTLVLNAPTGYSSYEWRIDGVGAGAAVTGSGATFTVEADNTNYNSIGKHIVYLVVKRGTVPYSKTIEFWITE
jgi:uncharacterized protein YjdB